MGALAKADAAGFNLLCSLPPLETLQANLEAGRLHLIISLACPWATKVNIMRSLKGLEVMPTYCQAHTGIALHKPPRKPGKRAESDLILMIALHHDLLLINGRTTKQNKSTIRPLGVCQGSHKLLGNMALHPNPQSGLPSCFHSGFFLWESLSCLQLHRHFRRRTPSAAMHRALRQIQHLPKDSVRIIRCVHVMSRLVQKEIGAVSFLAKTRCNPKNKSDPKASHHKVPQFSKPERHAN